MNLRLSDLWRWDGTVDRGPYLTIGVLGFALKHNLDRIVATAVFHQPWGIFNYLAPLDTPTGIQGLSRELATFYATLVALALPFIWVGLGLTLRRLRAIRLPTWLAVLFFAPVLNLVFFLLLAVIPTHPDVEEAETGEPLTARRRRDVLGRILPNHPVGSAAMALLLSTIFGAVVTLAATLVLRKYGWGLFVANPFCMGMGSVILYSYHGRRSFGTCMAVASLSTVLVGLALLAFAIEGVICVAMAAPIGLVLSLFGGCLGYMLQLRAAAPGALPRSLVVLALASPLLMGAEALEPMAPPVLRAVTSVEVAAPPEVVWRNVVSFSELPEPSEWLFRAGVSYPLRAEIAGAGPGAVRRCVFSTGAFVEPIETWDEPRLLKFSVTANPPPMEEWTPYHDVRPPHLNGFFLSHGGQFLLTPLPGGRTRLEGTTWYVHTMWPATYWELWSDLVIHKIHLRVLRHIQRLSEAAAQPKPEPK
ncbi:MAG: SRPBCC family protein [Planctomycetes bacterium]|nr:SRPBCC family protein [Planctomycetota bacterium]